MIDIKNNWKDFFEYETKQEYYVELRKFLLEEYKNKKIHPPANQVFNAFQLTDYNDIKVVIIGQDPFHGIDQAMGLAFSVNDNIMIPPSLRNIYKEIENDIGRKTLNENGNLTRWAEQGVFLLNTCLTVRQAVANSHAYQGWEIFTDNAIKKINESNSPIVYMLWGRCAQNKVDLITNNNHLTLKAAHPSPLSAYKGFLGCKHFSKANNFLKQYNLKEIEW